MPASSSVPFMPNLIYDAGMHSGQDTEFYLKKGFDVVGFEANPALCEQNRQTLAPYIESGPLRRVEGAIVPDPSVRHITFCTYEERSKWGAIMTEVAQSGEKRATGMVKLKVPMVDCAAVISETGIPYFLKIDIEGTDIHCLDVPRAFGVRPAYLLIEAIEQDIER